MNYSYDNSKDNEIIKKYNIVDDKIIVTFLDDSSVEMDYSYLGKIKELMYKRALEREQIVNKEEIVYNKKKSFHWMLAQLSLTFCSKKSLTSKVGDELRLLMLEEY